MIKKRRRVKEKKRHSMFFQQKKSRSKRKIKQKNKSGNKTNKRPLVESFRSDRKLMKTRIQDPNSGCKVLYRL